MSIFIENKKLFHNIAYSGIFQIGNWLIPLLTTPYLINIIGIDKFGLISFTLTFFIFLFTITDYGFNISATRVFAMSKKDNEYLSVYFSQVMLAKIVLCATSLIILFICCCTFKKFNNNLTFFLLSSLIVIGRSLLPNWYFQGIQEIRVVAILNFITQIIFLVLVIIFIRKPADYIYVIFIQGIGSIVISCIALKIAYKKINFIIPKLYSLKHTLLEGFYPFLTSASVMGYARINILVLGFLVNDTITGYYGAVERIIFIIRQIIGTVVSTIYPRVCYLTTISHQKVREFFHKVYLYFIIFIFIISSFIFFFSSDIVKIIIGTNIEVCTNILKILTLSLLIIIINTAYHSMMTAYGFNKVNAYVYFFAFFLSIFLNFILIHFFSVYGAALAVILIETFVTISFIIIMEKKYNCSLI